LTRSPFPNERQREISPLFFQRSITLFDQLIELFLLLSNALGCSFFILPAEDAADCSTNCRRLSRVAAIRSLSSGRVSDLSGAFCFLEN
jgi:hypothetical protein